MLAGVQSLDNEKRIRILGIIDKLRELGVSENVSLPQVRAESFPVNSISLTNDRKARRCRGSVEWKVLAA